MPFTSIEHNSIHTGAHLDGLQLVVARRAKAVQHLHEEMYGLQVRQLVIVGVHANAEKQAGVAAVDDLEGTELDEVGLVLLVARRDQAVDLGVSDGHVRSGRGRGGDNGVERDRWRV